MPIPVVCASCQTRLNAPDAAAGKKVKCPKCQAVMAVPAGDEPPPLPPPPAAAGTPFDFGGGSPPPPPPSRRSAPPPPESEAPPAPAGGAAFDFGAAVSAGGGGKPPREERGERRRRRDEGDDAPPPDRGDRPRRRPRDEDDAAAGDDDRPRGRGGKPAGGAKKFPWVLVLGGLMVLMLLCCGGPTGVYFFVIAPKVKEAAKKLEDDLKKIGNDATKNPGTGGGALPGGWVKFEAPDKTVRAAFPGAPDDSGLSYQSQVVTSAKGWRYLEADGSLTCTVAVVKFRAASKATDREKELKSAAALMAFGVKDAGAARTVDWLGGQAKETEGKSSLTDAAVVTRSVVVGTTGYIAVVEHKNKADAVTAFLTGVEVPAK